MSAEQKTFALAHASDLAIKYLWNDRKEDDEDLPLGAIEAMVEAGELTIQEIVDAFEAKLREGL